METLIILLVSRGPPLVGMKGENSFGVHGYRNNQVYRKCLFCNYCKKPGHSIHKYFKFMAILNNKTSKTITGKEGHKILFKVMLCSHMKVYDSFTTMTRKQQLVLNKNNLHKDGTTSIG